MKQSGQSSFYGKFKSNFLTPIILLLLLLGSNTGWGQTNPTPHNLSAGNFTFTGFAAGTTTTYPTSMQGWSFGSEPASAITSDASADRVLAVSTGTFSTGSIRNEIGSGISLLNSSTNNIGAICIAINTTNRGTIKANWTAAEMGNPGLTGTPPNGDRQNSIVLQYRVGTTGTWNTISNATYTSGLLISSGVVAAQTFSNISIPSDANNQSVVQLRWLYFLAGGTGSRDRIRLDDITISSIDITPTITGAANTSAFTTTYGTASDAQSFIISGSNLTANLVATAPNGFEVSADGTTYGSTATFTQSAGSASGTLRIRLAATAAVTGSYNSQNIVLSSTGATSVNITTPSTGNSVSAKALTITGLSAADKTYDGNTSVSVTGTPAYSGLANGESFSVTGSVSWAFSDANAGTSKPLSRTGSYDAPSSNYTITQPSLTASIIKAASSIISSPTASAITLGQALSLSTLSGGSATPAGSFTFTNPSFVPTSSGPYTADITYTPNDLNNYNIATGTTTVQVNEPLPSNIDYVNLQFPENANILVGGTMTAYAQVYVAGLTDAGSGQASGISAWIGYSTVNENPNSASFTWVPATFNVESGNNDEYQATFGASLPAGTYYYASRFQRNGGAFYYGGYPFGSWNGTSSNNGVLTITAPPTNIDYVNLQFPGNANILVGGTMTAYAQVYVAGLTDATSGQAAGISAWIGYSTVNENPNSASFTWVPATFNIEAGNNDEYQATFGATLPLGTYYYASRFQRNGGAYFYGGNPFGSWNGTSSISGVLTITCANPTTYYVDADGDGYGTGAGISSCTKPGGYATQAGDCNDANGSVNPGATEQCNGIDDDCDGQTDEGFTDTDADGSADCVDADDDNDGTNDGNDCAPLNASVQTPPAAVSPITGSDLICYAQTITLSTVTTGGVWSSSDPAVASIDQSGVVTGNTAGSATIQYTVTNSCGTSSASYPLTVNPQIILSTSVTNVTCPGGTNGAVNLTVSGGAPVPPPPSATFTQDFNTLSNSTASSVLPTGWFISESGTNGNATYGVGNGSSSTGDTYSFGSTGSTERALGSQLSGSVNSTFGARFTNNTGSNVTSISVVYTGEQWRLGSVSRRDSLNFQYSTDATSLTTGTWTDVNTLDFKAPEPGTVASAGALNGNDPAYRRNISGTITGLNIPNGSNLWVRWTDPDVFAADDGLAVDDFSITMLAEPPIPAYSYLWSNGAATKNISSVGANAYTVTVTDTKNCTGTINATVIAQDLVAPVVVTKNATVNLDANGTAVISAADINNGSTDNCGTVNLVSVTPSSFSCSDAVYIKDLFISEYVEGSSTNKAIEIYNGTAASVNLNQYRIKIFSNGATTATNTINLTGTVSAGGTHVLASTAVVLFSAANQTSVNLNFNGNDAVVLETISGQVIDVIGKIGQDPGTEWGSGSVTTSDKTLRRKATIRRGDTDGSNDFNPSLEWDAFPVDEFSDLRKHVVGTPVTLTVSDPSGNSSAGTAIVTVRDVINPTITAPATVNIVADNGSCAATNVSLGTPSTADNCGVASVTNNAPSSYAVGTTTVTWTVRDINGNTQTATQSVVVTDNQKPTITAPATINVNANNGVCVATNVSLGTPSTADNCGVASVTNNAPASFSVGTTTVTWTVTDIHGNTATATQDVVVTDNQNPTITSPATVNVNADNGSCVATNVTLGDATTADNCGVASVTNDAPASFPVGTTTVTWTVTDIHGNTATATQDVVVTDNQNPTITAPATVNTVADNGSCAATNVSLGTPSTADNCGVASVTNNAPASFSVGTTTVTWTVTDIHGNTATATQDVVVTDNQKPTITAPATVNTVADNGSCSATNVTLGDATTADNCGVASVTNDAPASYPVGTTTVTWTVTDIHGNTATATQDVVVTDNQNPTITAPATINTVADNGSCAATNVTLGDATTADNCGVASVTNDAPASYPVGTTTVTWTVTDVHGNTATATQDVVVTDNQNPTITAPATVNTVTDNGSCAATNVSLGTPSTADNCGVASVTNDAPASYPVGTTTVTWTVTDVNGNTATATQDVVVTDDQNPTITAPATVNVNADNGSCAATNVTLGDATTADNCGVASVTNDAPVSYPVGTTVVTWTVTDIHGNSSTTTQNVVVTDDQLPVIICPANITTSTDAGSCTKVITISSATATDNCGIATNGIVGVRSDGLALNAPYPFGLTTITWTATDVNGNQSSCNQTITVSQVTTVTSVTVTPGTQQYSDRVSFTATVTPNGCPAAGDVGGNITFRIGTQVMGTAPILSGVATLSDIALLEPLPSGTLPIGQMMPGVKNVTATVGGTDADYLVNNAATTFTITKENAIADYTGQEFASTGSATATTAPVRLSATVRDITAVDPLGDAHAGVIRNAKARFIIRTLNPTNMSVTSTSRTRWLQVNLLGTDIRVGSILLDTIFNIGSNNSLPYEIGVEVDSFYTSSTGSIASLVVSKTANDFVTYGGNILMNPNTSSGLYPSNTGSRLNFGGQAKWNKNGTNLQGGVNMIWRTGTKVYQVKGIVGGSNGSLSVNTTISTNRRATIVAKANVFDTETGLTVPNTNGSTITINLRDRGEPGTTDSIAIEVRNGAGQLVYSSNWTGIRTNERMLNGGNIQISGSNISTPSIRKSNDQLITSTTKSFFDLRVLGNPTENYFGLQPISSDMLNRMVIRITDVNGRAIEHFDQLKEGQTLLIGDAYRQGIYFAELIQGDQRKVVRLMKLK